MVRLMQMIDYDEAIAEQLRNCFYFFNYSITWRQRQSYNAAGFSLENQPIVLSQSLSNHATGQRSDLNP